MQNNEKSEPVGVARKTGREIAAVSWSGLCCEAKGGEMIGIDEKLREAYKQYDKAEAEIYRLLSKQRRYGEVCDCKTPEFIDLRGTEEPTEIYVVRYCVSCGGMEDA